MLFVLPVGNIFLCSYRIYIRLCEFISIVNALPVRTSNEASYSTLLSQFAGAIALICEQVGRLILSSGSKTMRVTSKTFLNQLQTEKRVSSSVAAQLSSAFDSMQKEGPSRKGRKPKQSGGRALVAQGRPSESKGEAAVRLALLAAFGSWHDGGEVIQELMPFPDRRYRADFALPRFNITCEVEGWTHHGRSLDDHHSDRLRSMFFAKHNWLVFNLSHGQALKEAGYLVDSIAHAMSLRTPIDRDQISVSPVPHKHGFWYRLDAGAAK